MRDRLVELLCNVKCEGEECFGNCPYRIGQKCNKVQRLEMCSVFAIADHLLKVGDTVYQTDGIRIYELEVFDVSLRKNKPYYETESVDFDSDAIGKTVFLTREEAEKALAERR